MYRPSTPITDPSGLTSRVEESTTEDLALRPLQKHSTKGVKNRQTGDV